MAGYNQGGLVPEGMEVNWQGQLVPIAGALTPSAVSASTPSAMSIGIDAQKDSLFGANPVNPVAPGGSVTGMAGDLSLEAMANKAAADAGTTFGIDNRSLSAGMDVANLGLGILNYADSKKMNKKTMAGMDQNLKNAQTEADATAKYRAAYGA